MCCIKAHKGLTPHEAGSTLKGTTVRWLREYHLVIQTRKEESVKRLLFTFMGSIY